MGNKLVREDQARQWYLRLRDDAGNDQLRREFEAWLEEDEKHAKCFNEIASFWSMIEEMPELAAAIEADGEPDPDLFLRLGRDEEGAVQGDAVLPFRLREKAFPKVPARSLFGRVPRPGRRLVAGAAILVIGLFSFYLYGAWLPEGTFRTGVGQQLVVTLEDGSVIRLNTDTRVREDYTKGLRKVRLLRGEASFEVARDATRPFVVETDYGRVKAVGTSFNVHETAGKVEIIVLEGRVAVEQPPNRGLRSLAPGEGAPGGEEQRLLAAGEKVYAYEDRLGRIGTASALELDKKTCWKKGKMIFRGQSLGDVIAEMGRYSSRKIIISDRRVRELKMGGVFDINDVDALVSAIQDAFPVKVIRFTPLLTIIAEA